MVVSTDSGMAITQIDAFLTEAPMTQIGKDMCFSNEIDHQRESAWVLTNILCCGSTEQVFQLWQMMEFCETDEDSQQFNPDQKTDNLLVKGLVRAIRSQQEAHLVKNCLEGFEYLLEMGEVKGCLLSVNDGIQDSQEPLLDQLVTYQANSALEACLLNHNLSSLAEDEPNSEVVKVIFDKANNLINVIEKFQEE